MTMCREHHTGCHNDVAQSYWRATSVRAYQDMWTPRIGLDTAGGHLDGAEHLVRDGTKLIQTGSFSLQVALKLLCQIHSCEVGGHAVGAYARALWQCSQQLSGKLLTLRADLLQLCSVVCMCLTHQIPLRLHEQM